MLGLWLGIMHTACGGSAFNGSVYRDDELAFRVGPQPASWHAIHVDGALLAFRDKNAGATVAVNGRCGVDGDDVPLRALTHHLFLHFTGRRVIDQQSLALDNREALRTEMLADLDGVPRRFIVYVLKKDNCVYDFVWIGATTPPAESAAEFQTFVQGFSTEI
jgi:hypothetical protein